MGNKSAIELWENFKKLNPDTPNNYEVWAFGDTNEMADELVELVIAGTKTATASCHLLYEMEKEPIPLVGLYNIILNGKDEAVAIIKTVSVEVCPFDEVSEEQAYLEGEGDRTLKYWRNVHEAFFRRELEDKKQEFHNKLLIVFERFELVYKKVNA
ncbi:ASCH domain-containing protein [Viridibacillus arvi]|uniref:ASCH domain-containing protein n=1 Tax=Viridibacillus arvi TaxID=263475 RepID=UPI00187B3BBD|nr:ASCH domain-containing protein [Viridibacillus sp. JNUCC-6]QOV10153.1 ASCH domain-containing protein [Viridibacillus sp. JNUCC-6]